jgi:hypothetical protein
VGQQVGRQLAEQHLDPARRVDTEDLAALVAADVQVPGDVEGQAVGPGPRGGRDLLPLPGRPVVPDGDARHPVGEGLGHVQVPAIRAQGEPVGEGQVVAVPQLAAAVGVEPEHARPRPVELVAVGDVQPAGGVERRGVGDAEPVAGCPVGEPLDPARAGLDPEHGGVLEVADEQVVVGAEGHAEAEAAGAGDLLDDGAGGVDPVDLAALPAAPDRPVAVHGQPLRVVELGVAEGAVDEHAGPARLQEPGGRPHG